MKKQYLLMASMLLATGAQLYSTNSANKQAGPAHPASPPASPHAQVVHAPANPPKTNTQVVHAAPAQFQQPTPANQQSTANTGFKAAPAPHRDPNAPIGQYSAVDDRVSGDWHHPNFDSATLGHYLNPTNW